MVPWLLTGNNVDRSEATLTTLGSRHANIVPPGAVLVSCIGTLGKVAISGTTLAMNQQSNSVIVDNKKLA